MASSGSFNTTGYSGRYLVFSWKIESQNVATNTTTISWALKGAGGSSIWYMTQNIVVIIDGKTVYDFPITKGQIKLHNGTTVTSGTYTFAHADDGSRSFSASVEAGIYNWSPPNAKGSGNFTIDTIARASQPSLVTYPETTNDVGDFGVEFGIHMNRKSPDFTHTVRYEYGERSGVIARNVENGVTWAVPLDFMNDIPNATSGSGRIYVDTYNGSTFVGTKYTGFTATVPASVKPRCTIQVLDNTDNLERYGNLVKGLSKLYVKTNFYAAYSSPVTAYNVTANGAKYTKAEVVTGVLTAAGTTTITAAVTDKRGRTSETVSASFPVVDYAPPKITALAVHRCNKDGTANDRGEYVEVLFSGEVSPINNKNSATYSVKYKKTSEASWTNLTEDVNGWKPSDIKNNFNVNNFALIFSADGSSSYDVEVFVQDNHGTASRTTSASTAFTLINYHPAGNAMRFGGVCEVENAFQNDLNLIQRGNQYCFNSPGTAAKNGFVRIAEITVTGMAANAPIVFELLRRGANTPMIVNVLFVSTNSKKPALQTIWYEGTNYDAYLTETSDSVWGLYVKKADANDDITLSRWYTAEYMNDRVSVIFTGDHVDTVPLGLNGYFHATPAVLRSIIDCLLPVGMIIQLYSHADPNTMYPGTTWVRMANTFLWGADASGTIGQTGGEKTHELTVNELPVHSHGAVYSANAAGTKSQAWYSTSGDKLAYGVVETGGGAGHNNMPPYTQVSIWRRTA